MKYILVTGYCGYIGSQICKQLKQQGYGVVGVDLVDPQDRELYSKYVDRQLSFDYSNNQTFHALTRYNIKTVIHTAASSLVGPSVLDPDRYYKNNVDHLHVFLNICKQAGVERIVFSSSAAVYGDGHQVFYEDTVKNPISPYGRSKLAGEWLIEDYCRAYGLTGVALRYFNVCGADIDGEFGQVGKPSHIFTVGLTRAIAGESIVINGNDYNTKDGTCERDYVHVVDVANANVLAIAAPVDGFVAVNIGSGVGFSNLDIVDAINQHGSHTLNHSFGPARAGDPAQLISDIGRAKDLLNWQPTHSDFETIVTTAEQWHQKLYQEKIQ
jgi:UDP-glucose-4-epimerase GalE